MQNSLHFSLLSAEKILAICEPFFKQYNLNCFSYSRVYPDGARTELWSDAKASEHTFLNKKYIVGAYTPKYFSDGERYAYVQSKVIEYPRLLRGKYTNQLVDQREYFNHDHCFMVINREIEFCKYFIYYAPIERRSMLNFYFNNLDILENFSAHFKIVAADLINTADEHRLLTPRSQLPIVENNVSSFQDKKHRFACLNPLTARESHIAHLLLTGKTARGVGEILNISKRTAESHIEHIKIKLNCYKKSDLIDLLFRRLTT